MLGTLYLVATPIGNLQDISRRALETLETVDLIACEDTRHSAKLLNNYGISKRLVSYHDHNERERAGELIARLERGESVAVVSDAGTPGINDPGHEVVTLAIDAGVTVVSIPGPVAYVNAVVASGLPTDSIFFGGFLPSRKGERVRRLEEIKPIPATLAFYESPHRLKSSLLDCLEVLGDRRSAVARELTKMHEEIVRGSLKSLAGRFADASVKGEIVLVVDGPGENIDERPAGGSLPERVGELERAGLDRKAALKAAAKEFGVSRSEAYRRMQNSGK